MKKILLGLVFILTLALIGGTTVFNFPSVGEVLAHGKTNNAWSTPVLGTCTPKNDCGPEGTQTATYSCVCSVGSDIDCKTHVYVEGRKYADKIDTDPRPGHTHWECPSHDSAYTSDDSSKPCSREVNIDTGAETKVENQDCTLTEYKACTVDLCSNLTGMQETLPEGVQANENNYCSCKEGYHEVIVEDGVKRTVVLDGYDNFTCEPDQSSTPTPTPTQTPSNPGGPGDGKSDGRSDGRSSCPECTQAPATAAVLGASTGPAVLGLSTTSGEESVMLQLVQLFGALVSGAAGFTFFKKNA
jgi:hypothetical protein